MRECETMVEKTKVRTADKWKKKKWFAILAPSLFDQKELIETVSEKPETLNGRILKVSAREFGEVKKTHISFKFKVFEVQGLKAYTKLLGHEVNQGYLKRLIRRRSSKIESTQTIQSKDGRKVKIKTIAVSMRKLTQKQKTAVRKIIEKHIREEAKKMDSENFVKELIFGNIVGKMLGEIKKIALMKRIEIVESRILEGK